MLLALASGSMLASTLGQSTIQPEDTLLAKASSSGPTGVVFTSQFAYMYTRVRGGERVTLNIEPGTAMTQVSESVSEYFKKDVTQEDIAKLEGELQLAQGFARRANGSAIAAVGVVNLDGQDVPIAAFERETLTQAALRTAQTMGVLPTRAADYVLRAAQRILGTALGYDPRSLPPFEGQPTATVRVANEGGEFEFAVFPEETVVDAVAGALSRSPIRSLLTDENLDAIVFELARQVKAKREGKAAAPAAPAAQQAPRQTVAQRELSFTIDEQTYTMTYDLGADPATVIADLETSLKKKLSDEGRRAMTEAIQAGAGIDPAAPREQQAPARSESAATPFQGERAPATMNIIVPVGATDFTVTLNEGVSVAGFAGEFCTGLRPNITTAIIAAQEAEGQAMDQATLDGFFTSGSCNTEVESYLRLAVAQGLVTGK